MFTFAENSRPSKSNFGVNFCLLLCPLVFMGPKTIGILAIMIAKHASEYLSKSSFYGTTLVCYFKHFFISHFTPYVMVITGKLTSLAFQ